MTGLEKIVKKIEDEANASAAARIEVAQTEAQTIYDTTMLKAKAQSEEILAQGRAQAADILAGASSAAALAKRKALLSEKQSIINSVISDAQNALLALPEKEYFELIERLFEKHLLAQQGEIFFSAADLKRLPTGFGLKLGVIAMAKGGSLKVSKEPRAINGGFILVYPDAEAGGDIEINCSFEALFYAAHEQLQDKISALLFF